MSRLIVSVLVALVVAAPASASEFKLGQSEAKVDPGESVAVRTANSPDPGATEFQVAVLSKRTGAEKHRSNVHFGETVRLGPVEVEPFTNQSRAGVILTNYAKRHRVVEIRWLTVP